MSKTWGCDQALLMGNWVYRFVQMVEEPGGLVISLKKQSVKVVYLGTWTTVCAAVPLSHRMERKKQVLCCHTAGQYVLASIHLLPNHFKSYWNACRKEKWVQRQSFVSNGAVEPLLTSLNWWRLSEFEENSVQKFKVTWQWRRSKLMLHRHHFQSQLVKWGCCRMSHYNAFICFPFTFVRCPLD